MATINISLSEELKRYVSAQVKGGAYGNVSEFFRSLIRRHQEHAIQARLERLLLDGIESGSVGPLTRSDWDELRRVALERAQTQIPAPGEKKAKRIKNAPGATRPGRNRGVLRRGVK